MKFTIKKTPVCCMLLIEQMAIHYPLKFQVDLFEDAEGTERIVVYHDSDEDTSATIIDYIDGGTPENE